MPVERSVRIVTRSGLALEANLAVPDERAGVVVFAHGSGSSRLSPRNRMVAARLWERGFATLLVDLLTEDEASADRRSGHLRFDIELLASRVAAAAEWVRATRDVGPVPLTYFGASTGAAAALVAAARDPSDVVAVVSRGGRPDLAGDWLQRVRAPTLLIVGSRDEAVLELNRAAQARLGAPSRLEIIPGATHLFEEAGALEAVADVAGDWLRSHVGEAGSGGHDDGPHPDATHGGDRRGPDGRHTAPGTR